ncbi:MAG: FmdB family zinc ribbon protein [Opitutales bacterium]
MPLYEFQCEACDHEFEVLTRAGQAPACPACDATALRKKWSTFAAQGGENTPSAPDPGHRQSHGAGCGCCGGAAPGACGLN